MVSVAYGPRKSLPLVFTLALSGILALAGCSKSHGSTPATSRSSTEQITVSASPTPTSTWTPAQQDAANQVLAVYKAYGEASQRAAAAGEYTAELGQYINGQLLADTRTYFDNLKIKGYAYVGEEISTTPRITSVDLQAKPALVKLTDCIDGTSLRLVYKSNHSPVPVPSHSRKIIGDGSAAYVEGKGWQMIDFTEHTDQPC